MGWLPGYMGVQAFATLSTTESELLGYVDGLTMGESVGAVINVLRTTHWIVKDPTP